MNKSENKSKRSAIKILDQSDDAPFEQFDGCEGTTATPEEYTEIFGLGDREEYDDTDSVFDINSFMDKLRLEQEKLKNADADSIASSSKSRYVMDVLLTQAKLKPEKIFSILNSDEYIRTYDFAKAIAFLLDCSLYGTLKNLYRFEVFYQERLINSELDCFYEAVFKYEMRLLIFTDQVDMERFAMLNEKENLPELVELSYRSNVETQHSFLDWIITPKGWLFEAIQDSNHGLVVETLAEMVLNKDSDRLFSIINTFTSIRPHLIALYIFKNYYVRITFDQAIQQIIVDLLLQPNSKIDSDVDRIFINDLFKRQTQTRSQISVSTARTASSMISSSNGGDTVSNLLEFLNDIEEPDLALELSKIFEE